MSWTRPHDRWKFGLCFTNPQLASGKASVTGSLNKKFSYCDFCLLKPHYFSRNVYILYKMTRKSYMINYTDKNMDDKEKRGEKEKRKVIKPLSWNTTDIGKLYIMFIRWLFMSISNRQWKKIICVAFILITVRYSK